MPFAEPRLQDPGNLSMGTTKIKDLQNHSEPSCDIRPRRLLARDRKQIYKQIEAAPGAIRLGPRLLRISTAKRSVSRTWRRWTADRSRVGGAPRQWRRRRRRSPVVFPGTRARSPYPSKIEPRRVWSLQPSVERWGVASAAPAFRLFNVLVHVSRMLSRETRGGAISVVRVRSGIKGTSVPSAREEFSRR
jgi:hypothetical protein